MRVDRYPDPGRHQAPGSGRTPPAHPALVDRHVFDEVALRLAARDTTSSRTSTVRTRRPYALRGLLTCAACERRMQGTWNHDRAHYRCRFPNEYAIANRSTTRSRCMSVKTPSSARSMSGWPAVRTGPCAAGAHRPGRAADRRGPRRGRGGAATRRVRPETGEPPGRARGRGRSRSIAAWTADAQRRRDAISARLQVRSTPRSTRTRPAQIVDLVSALGGVLEVLRRAGADDKCDVYRQLGLSVVYRHEDRTALAQVRPRTPVDVVDVSEGGLAH